MLSVTGIFRSTLLIFLLNALLCELLLLYVSLGVLLKLSAKWKNKENIKDFVWFMKNYGIEDEEEEWSTFLAL